MRLPVQLKAYADRVDARLDQLLPATTRPPTELAEAMRYSALAPGKRLRPALVLAATEALNSSAAALDSASLDAACAVEMVHAFSLIHDDLPALDNDDLRRGRPTCHIVYGEAVAVLAGDALFSLAMSTLANVDAGAEQVVASIRVLTDATNRLVSGETLDVVSEGKPIDPDVLAQIHSEKTGALIAASTAIGAIIGGGSPEEVAALRTYGEKVGLAFQIADDILNETATPEQLGKATGSDRERQKATYPALFGVERSRRAAIEATEQGIEALKGIPHPDLLTELAGFAVVRLH